MKGIVFTEFFNMVEEKWGIDMIDDLIDASDLTSGGAYTSVATYDHGELLRLVSELSRKTEIEPAVLVRTFGTHLAKSFVQKFPSFFSDAQTTFDVLKRVDDHIHVEVRKLYPDAELPEFSHEEISATELRLIYKSTRNMPDLAHGLIEGCAVYFNEEIQIERSSGHQQPFTIEVFKLKKC